MASPHLRLRRERLVECLEVRQGARSGPFPRRRSTARPRRGVPAVRGRARSPCRSQPSPVARQLERLVQRPRVAQDSGRRRFELDGPVRSRAVRARSPVAQRTRQARRADRSAVAGAHRHRAGWPLVAAGSAWEGAAPTAAGDAVRCEERYAPFVGDETSSHCFLDHVDGDATGRSRCREAGRRRQV
jgi:hypothetical protein